MQSLLSLFFLSRILNIYVLIFASTCSLWEHSVIVCWLHQFQNSCIFVAYLFVLTALIVHPAQFRLIHFPIFFVKNYSITCLFPFIYSFNDFNNISNLSQLILGFHTLLHRENKTQKHEPKKRESPSEWYFLFIWKTKILNCRSYLLCSHFSW